MKQINEIWETYRSCWSDYNSNKRTSNLRGIMSDDFEYRDPNIELKGYRQLSDYMAQFQKEFKDASFVISNLNAHHNKLMAHWNMVNSKNEVVGSGIDFAQYANGKIKEITGFFEENEV